MYKYGRTGKSRCDGHAPLDITRAHTRTNPKSFVGGMRAWRQAQLLQARPSAAALFGAPWWRRAKANRNGVFSGKRAEGPLLARLGPKRTGRVSPLWRGTSNLNFPGNLLRRHHCSLNSDGTGSPVSLSRTIARSTIMPFRRTTSQPRSSLSMARSNVAESGRAPPPEGWSGSSKRPWFS